MYKILVWGTGSIANQVLEDCETIHNYEILGFIDNNQEKIGKIFRGKTVYSIKVLEQIIPDKIVILAGAYNEIFKQIIKSYPQFRDKIEDKEFFYKESILCRYKGTKDTELITVLSNIKEKGLSIFNYSFIEKYKESRVPVYFDSNCKLYYVIHMGKPMYFSKKFDTEEKVINYYRSILLEQDEESPHRYLSNDFDVSEGSIVVDIGVAEGNFAIEVIDRVSKIYLIESDDDWIEALKETFKDFKDKVIIKKAFVSSYDEGHFSRLDSLIDEAVDFIKMDIEGNEWDALWGAEQIINQSSDIKLAVCCYHSDFDQCLIEDYMNKHKISHDTTKGYMWFPYMVKQNYVSTRLNRGIVRGRK